MHKTCTTNLKLRNLVLHPMGTTRNTYIYSLVITDNIASKPRNIVYIPRLTDERIEEYKVDEYIALYSSVTCNGQI
jgi:hypothetical protein